MDLGSVSGQDRRVSQRYISRAFDRVAHDLLIAKCRRAGLKDVMCKFPADLFQPCRASVVVQGSHSFTLSSQALVFQGTRLGPPAWNICFADVVAMPVRQMEFDETLIANDLTCTREFGNAIANDTINDAMHECQ